MSRFFIIEVTVNERDSNYEYISASLKDAEKHVMEHADWYCSNGTCRIIEVDNNFNLISRREYSKGIQIGIYRKSL